MSQKITPFFWFDTQAEEAANFYVSVFADRPGATGNSTVSKVVRYDEAGAQATGKPVGSAMTAAFDLEGQQFVALNGGPGYPFNQAVSFVVNCDTQEEVDHFWEKLTADGGKEVQCGWLTDKFGLPWQIIPTILPKLLSNSNPGKAGAAMSAMLKMKKIVIADLEKAVGGE